MEFVYVVPREGLFPDFYPHGLVPFGERMDRARFEAVAAERGFFVERDYAERTPALKQLIPYALVCRGSELLLLRRTRKGGEVRLHDKLSIGVGGHVNPVDLETGSASAPGRGALTPGAFGTELESGATPLRAAHGGPSSSSSDHPRAELLAAATRRELEEELHLSGPFTIEPVGILNDDSNPVGAVHTGLVQLVQVEGDVRIREMDQLEGRFVGVRELRSLLHDGADFETWSELLVRRIDELIPRPAVSLS